jgi:hypothetical protein
MRLRLAIVEADSRRRPSLSRLRNQTLTHASADEAKGPLILPLARPANITKDVKGTMLTKIAWLRDESFVGIVPFPRFVMYAESSTARLRGITHYADVPEPHGDDQLDSLRTADCMDPPCAQPYRSSIIASKGFQSALP